MFAVIVVVLIAAFFGGALGDGFGALAGALLAWLGWRSFRQERRIAVLEQALRRGDLAAPAAASAPPVAVGPAEVDLPIEVPEPMSAAATTVAEPVAATAPPARPHIEPVDEETEGRPVEAPSGVLSSVVRWFFGGNTIVKAGVGILFVGLAFLAKYASEHVSLPVELRLAGIGAVAIVLLAIGWRLRASRPGYAQVLQGGAVAVLYLTLFVAFRFYGVIAVGPVFGLMVAVAALAAALAVLQDARSLAVVGALGGFATPLLVSTGSGNHVALFSYYLVLDLGIAAVAWFRTWRVLNAVGFLFTFVVATAWGLLKYRPDDYATSQLFLIAYFVLFSAVALMPARRAAEVSRGEAWVNGTLMFGLPTIAFVLQYGLVHERPYGVAFSALMLAAWYIALAAWLRRRPQLALAFEGSLAVGAVFLTLVIPFALDARSTAGAWALEGAGLVWLGFRQARRTARWFGYALLALAGGTLIWAAERHGTPTGALDPQLFNGVLVALASLAAARAVQRYAEAKGGESIAEVLLVGWATLWLAVVAVQEVAHVVPHGLRFAAAVVAVSAIALLYTALAHRFAWRSVAVPTAAHAPLLLASTAVLALEGANPLADGGWWAWPIALAVHAGVLARALPQAPTVLRTPVHAVGVWLLAALGALLGRWASGEAGDAVTAWPWLGWFAVPALLLVALPRPGLAARWPVRLDPRAYQGIAAGVLAAVLLGWTLLANALSTGAARPLPHVPFLNPLDVGIAIALAAAALWLRSEAGRAAIREPRVGLGVLAACAFAWSNAVLLRAFHHWGGVPYDLDAWADALPVQTGLTLLWSALALATMWWAARRAERLPWMAGAALLGAVVVKLLLVDLSGTGTVTRIVSFIGVGVLMLVIGYVAPLPGKEERHAAT